MPVRYGHLAPFLDELRLRSNLTVSALAQATGVSIEAMHRRLHNPAGLATETILKAARVCGATDDELTRICVLDAMDRGVIALPDGCTYEQARAALALLETADS